LFFVQIPKWKRTKNREIKQESSWENKFFRLYKEIQVILKIFFVDRAGWHMTKTIRCFSNVTLLPLPPYSPELNPVEQLWQQIKQRFLSNEFVL
jgi:transposase